ncbi:cupredoxin domain-containing protein [Billgrantia lactosivorans]|uniref:cupredoxin domain-containing protein n=1 Tax=Billgrantia lactosivorans TaxID=2185141 RepID=UPI000DAD3D8B|nr:plastocyanin/azurin family copper-binding protein [Halomonas lactosivorans]
MAKASKTSLGAALAALLLSGAAGADNDVVEVEMRDYGFHPAELEVEAGTTVRWVNTEKRTSHDVYFVDEERGSQRLFPAEHWERTFDEPGTYPYRCRPHESRDMQGMIVVVPTE